jgi:hypothetical protein
MQGESIEYLYSFDDRFDGVEGLTRLETSDSPTDRDGLRGGRWPGKRVASPYTDYGGFVAVLSGSTLPAS